MGHVAQRLIKSGADPIDSHLDLKCVPLACLQGFKARMRKPVFSVFGLIFLVVVVELPQTFRALARELLDQHQVKRVGSLQHILLLFFALLVFLFLQLLVGLMLFDLVIVFLVGWGLVLAVDVLELIRGERLP